MDLSNVKSITIAEGIANQITFEGDVGWEEYAPTLAPSNTWYKGTPLRNTITSIAITTKYMPTGNEDESWNADSEDSGAIKAYLIGTNLTLVITDGSRFLYANPDSSLAFGGNNASTRWSKVTSFTGTELINTRKVTTMSRMFDGLFLLEDLEVGHFDTSNVTSMYAVFNNCEQLRAIDVSKWDTSKVTEMYAMFADCTKLTKLDCSNWDTRNVGNANSLCYDCFLLEEIDLNNADWCGITDFGMSFYKCNVLKKIKLNRSGKSHNGSKASLQGILSDCPSLIEFDSTNFSTEGATDISWFFEGCSSIENVRLRNFDYRSDYNPTNFFSGCINLKRVDFGEIVIFDAPTANIFPTSNDLIEVYVSTEEEKEFVATCLANGAKNVVIYVAEMPYMTVV